MFSKKLFCVVAMLIGMVASFGAYAQNLTVRGTVKDATGPVVGAVVLSGGANAVTDVNGNYSITVPSNAVLEVSCLGYATQNVNVNGRSVIDIVLAEDAEMLQEAVALGYGAQTKKKDLSASVGIVSNPEKLAGRPVTSTTAMLQGQVPGVVVSFSNGAPMAVARPVQDGAAGHGTVKRRHHLQGLPGIEYALFIGRHNLDTLLSHLKPVSRFELPIGQFPTFQEAPDRTIRDADLLRQSQGFIGPYDSGAHGKLHRCRNDV